MVTYVLDASAVLRYLDDEAGAERVEQIVKKHVAGKARVAISTIHWGEIAGIVMKRHGEAGMRAALSRLSAFGFEVVSVTADRAVRSATIKNLRKIPYADAFGIDLAEDSPEHILVTADFDAKPAQKDVRIEFLPLKKKQ
ncbi:MAG: PIN domain-containing protein [Acidobacteria bacterium]|nr:PIN domain-containing protein [Acidobacteriota bacterium]